ncbi:MAG TPA: FtsK/SpoIIIE domain-containing protein [Thermobifida alba]|nr:FtsK/SpoIIIE domain-containing protein [Thermobifida alba]
MGKKYFDERPGIVERAATGLVRGAWRYRVQLAPVYTATGLAAAGAAAHAAWGEYWMIGAGASPAIAVSTWLYAKVQDLEPFRRVWAAACTGAASAWVTAAMASGVLERPLPDLLVLGTAALGAPWWINRRTRSRVSVEQRIEAWPAIAATRAELRDSEVISAQATSWGWTARVKLAAGITGRRAIEARDSIESALEVREGAVRIEPSKTSAREVTVHVTEVDPHAEPIIWPGPTMESITDPLVVGIYDDGADCAIQLYSERGARHMMICGQTGSGKSGLVNLLLAELVSLGNVVIWGIDLKGGQELGPWKQVLDRCATTVEEAVAMLKAGARVVTARGQAATDRVWKPTPAAPALVIVMDEAAELLPVDYQALEAAKSVVRRGRSVGVSLIGSAQDSTTAAWGATDLQAQMTMRAGFRMEARKAKYAIKDLPLDYEVLQAIDEDTPGVGYIEAPGVKRPAPMRVRWIDDDTVASLVAAHAADRPELDALSEEAALDDPAVYDEKNPQPDYMALMKTAGDDTEDAPAAWVPAARPAPPETEEETMPAAPAAMPADDDLAAIPADLSDLSLRSMGTEPLPAAEPPALSDTEALKALWQALAEAPEGGVRLAGKDLERAVTRKKSWIYARVDDWEGLVVKVGRGGYRLAPGAPAEPPVLTPA